jgi:hypothetical protein
MAHQAGTDPARTGACEFLRDDDLLELIVVPTSPCERSPGGGALARLAET